MRVLLLAVLPWIAAASSNHPKRSMVWVYGSALYPAGTELEATLAALASHTDSFNAIAPQMYSVGCDSTSTANGCAPILISDTSDPGVTPPPSLARRFHELGDHVQYWPTLSSPDWLNAAACQPPLCYNGTGDPTARCPCGQAPNETATMEALLASPDSLIASAIAEAKRWNISGYNVDMEAPSPLGDDALPVVKFVNKLAKALAAVGVQTSYCIGRMNRNLPLARMLNQTAMRVVPMGLYGSYNDDWLDEVKYWKEQGMAGKLGVGFCPTCNSPSGEPVEEIASKFKVAREFDEIDMFAFEAGAEKEFAPYWEHMKAFLGS